MVIFFYERISYIESFISFPSEVTLSSADKIHIEKKKSHLSKYSSLLARKILNRICGRIGIKPVLGYHNGGKPYLINNPNVGISFSYSAPFVVVMLNTSGQCGVDTEIVKKEFPKFAKDFFHPDEQRSLKVGPRKSRRAYALWTYREALAKANGQSILAQDPLNTLFVAKGDSWTYKGKGKWIFDHEFLEHNLLVSFCYTNGHLL